MRQNKSFNSKDTLFYKWHVLAPESKGSSLSTRALKMVEELGEIRLSWCSRDWLILLTFLHRSTGVKKPQHFC